MKLQPAAIELVVSDMATSLAFYRRLGLDIPPEADAAPRLPHTPFQPSWWPSRRACETSMAEPIGW